MKKKTNKNNSILLDGSNPDSTMALAAGDEKNISSPRSERTGITTTVMIGIGLSDSAAMTYQIAWTRTISLFTPRR